MIQEAVADLFANGKICIGPFKDASRSSHAWRRDVGCLDNHCWPLDEYMIHVTLELEVWVGFELELEGTYSYCWVMRKADDIILFDPFCVCFVQCPCGLSIVEGIELV